MRGKGGRVRRANTRYASGRIRVKDQRIGASMRRTDQCRVPDSAVNSYKPRRCWGFSARSAPERLS
ncbi:Uncharacterised protein [Amycolatopsis camponoti]|uniref:Uncharacterized protein n=1 Tax=Amycolatopsis camponoti TaxID=2606593 RepID=A0A6I8M9G5_9PSEU|nr:Uncharacterised protein [Amycolatopsis camponoti]